MVCIEKIQLLKESIFFTNVNIYVTVVLKSLGLMHQNRVKFSSGITLCGMNFSSFQDSDIVNNTFSPASFAEERKKTEGWASDSTPAWERLGGVAERCKCPSPQGLHHSSFLYYVSASRRQSWWLSYKLLLILPIEIKFGNNNCKPPL